MYFTIYKITNVINSKVYIGMHKTEDLEDGYMGSGIAITRSIKKYGTENFTKEYLHILDTKEEMIALEESIVDQEFVDRKDTYNLVPGGQNGGIDKAIDRQKWLRKNDLEWVTKDNLVKSKRFKKMHQSGEMTYDNFKDKKHTDKTIILMKKTHAKNKHAQGKKNSQYGTMWIYNLELKISKKISKGDLIPDGWLKGRKIKF